MRFLISETNREHILMWLDSNVGTCWPRSYQWFPFYRTPDNRPAFMVCIYRKEDCTAFTLSNGEYIAGVTE